MPVKGFVVEKALEIARQEVQRVYAVGGVPKSVDCTDLLSVANETIVIFFHRYPGAGADDLKLLRVTIRCDLKDALKKEYRLARGIEIPDQRRDPAYDVLDYDELVARGVPPECAALLRRYYIDGETQQQLATSLGIDQSVVSDRLRAAKKKIRNILLQTHIGPPSESILGRANRHEGVGTRGNRHPPQRPPVHRRPRRVRRLQEQM
jgi:RNA polymerase sigma factor (sigma-70 family)